MYFFNLQVYLSLVLATVMSVLSLPVCKFYFLFPRLQWIKEKIAQTIKALQKRYVATDTAVTSEDAEVNLLCCALEAVFIHGIKSKYIRSEVRGRGRKGGGRDSVLPQPDFWGLLKSVTHR